MKIKTFDLKVAKEADINAFISSVAILADGIKITSDGLLIFTYAEKFLTKEAACAQMEEIISSEQTKRLQATSNLYAQRILKEMAAKRYNDFDAIVKKEATAIEEAEAKAQSKTDHSKLKVMKSNYKTRIAQLSAVGKDLQESVDAINRSESVIKNSTDLIAMYRDMIKDVNDGVIVIN